MAMEMISRDSPSPPLRVLWWLREGKFTMGPEWQKAHEICQLNEGDHAHDLVHALAHWVEGDKANANYWYARVGGTRASTIEAEWQRIAKLLAE
jgi:hypothetical protein